MIRSQFLGTLCACVLSFTLASSANASFVLTIDDLSNGTGVDVTVTDGGAGDTNAAPGIIGYSDTLGSFILSLNTGFSKPFIAPPQLLHLNSVDISGGPGSLIISLTDTDYTGPFPTALTGLFGGVTAGSVDFDFLVDEFNAEFGGVSFFNPPAVTVAGAFSGESTSLL